MIVEPGVGLAEVCKVQPARAIRHVAIAAILRVGLNPTRIGRIAVLTAGAADRFRIRTRCMIPSMRRLADARELLDGDLDDPEVLDGNLRDLRRINRQFGGAQLSVRAVRALLAESFAEGRDPLRVLDVGAGACDISLALSGAHGPWRSVRVTAVDSRPEVLDAAARVEPALAARPDVELLVADGRSLPFPDDAFDVAHASLVLHHLDPIEVHRFLSE